jgi:nuclear RNA export factor
MAPRSAKINGWDVVIMSDQWVIRGYSNHEAWKPGPMLVQAGQQQTAPLSIQQSQPSLPLPPAEQAALAAIVCLASYPFFQSSLTRFVAFQPELQRSMVVQICGLTRLNVKFALDCLTGNGWDLEKAVANFNEVKVCFLKTTR